MRFVAGRGANGSDSRGTHVQVAARALMGSNRRGADVQVASRGPMGSNSRSTNEVLLAGATWWRAIGKQLRTRIAPAGKETHCEQG